jgi:prepilin-type N-terminal cleavage/methylation domain-containing protein
MSRSRKKNKSGLTLVEVLVATAIMAFCLSGMLLTYINMVTLTDVTRAFTLANNAGQHIMEVLKSNTFDNVTNSTLSSSEIDAILTNSEFDSENAWARIQVVNDAALLGSLKKVKVMVFFKLRNRAMWQDKDEDLVPDWDDVNPEWNEVSSVEIVNYVGNYTTGGFAQ